ncbi:MAG: hypothetical protein AAGH83_08310 [Pseudomonadota bacterium]
MTPEEIARHFTRSDGRYVFARWRRPLAPVAFGVTDETLAVIKGAIEAVSQLTGQGMAETDPELGANLMLFFIRDWGELTETPNLDRMIPELARLVARLDAAGANQYRIFRFDQDGVIRACFVFLRMDAELLAMPADELALGQIVQSVLLWSDAAFLASSPLAVLPKTGATILRPEIGGLIRAAYDPLLPDAADDAAHALRLYARMAVAG